MTRAAFLNAAAVVMATAGSTNAVLHLLAIATEAEVELTLDDFDAISRRTPLIASMRPAGRYVMSELDQAGGLPVVLRELLSAGLVDGDALSVNGKTLAQNVQDALAPDGDVVRPVKEPIKAGAGWPSCAAAWCRTAPWSRHRAWRRCGSTARPGCSKTRRTASRPSPRARWPRAMS